MPTRARFLLTAAVTALVALGSLGAVSVASADPGDIGFIDHSYAPLTGSPTGSKPESKLWFNDGIWWSTMFNGSAGEWRIYRLNSATGVWSDTGVATDPRDGTRADALWDGSAGKLYLASHVFTTSGGSTTAANAGRLYRYSYNAGTKAYSLDTGFPVTINAARTETLVIDKDSTGTLWATWTAGSQVFVNHSTGGDGATWGTPYVVPGAANLTSDDISSLIHYGANKIGVMWSNQSTKQFLFATHTDGTGDTAASWSTAVVPTGASSDDHINLKADSTGRVYAAVKTSETSSTRPMIQLLVRSTAGSWSAYTYGVPNLHTRPIVELDEEHSIIHVLATCPQPPATSGQSGGDICEKTTPMSSISFAPGPGTAVIRDQGSPGMNDATSTKQNLNSTTGLVVMANNADTNFYWHMQESLGGSVPPPVTAGFSGTPTSGTAPVAVTFTDSSTGGPTMWSWSFGDGQTSSAQNPVHTYTAAGTYTVTLTASNASSTDTATKTGYITVNPSGGGGGGTTTFTAAADSYVRSASTGSNFGTASTLRVRTSAGDDYRTLLKFNVSGITGAVTDAKLRLFVTDPSPDGGRIYLVNNSWTETGVNWTNAPAIGASPIASIGSTPAANNWVEVPLGSAITGDGTYSLELVSSSSNSTIYTSREGANKPELVITAGTGGTPPPVAASFTGTPTSGTAPLDVTFSDSSTGNPTSWSWSFGDGQTSNAQNPVHTYATAGTYTVSLTAGNGTSSDTSTLTNYITVNPAGGGGGGGGITTFTAVADTHVRDTSPTTNYGGLTTLRVRTDAAGDDYRTLLKFDVASLTGTITSAKLRLWVTDASPDTGRVYAVSNGWTELGVNWNTAPAISDPPVASIGTTTAVGAWVEVEVAPAITGNGTFSFELVNSSTNSAIFSSREGVHAPELVITTS
jgi:PKD repeat protein